MADQFVDDLIGADSFGVGVEVGEEPMPQDRLGHSAHIFAADVQPAVQDGAGLGAEDQILSRARAGAPGEPFVDERRRVRFLGPRRAGQADGVIDDVIAHRQFAQHFLHVHDVGRRSTGSGSASRSIVVARTICRSSFLLG